MTIRPVASTQPRRPCIRQGGDQPSCHRGPRRRCRYPAAVAGQSPTLARYIQVARPSCQQTAVFPPRRIVERRPQADLQLPSPLPRSTTPPAEARRTAVKPLPFQDFQRSHASLPSRTTTLIVVCVSRSNAIYQSHDIDLPMVLVIVDILTLTSQTE